MATAFIESGPVNFMFLKVVNTFDNVGIFWPIAVYSGVTSAKAFPQEVKFSFRPVFLLKVLQNGHKDLDCSVITLIEHLSNMLKLFHYVK